MAKKPIKIYSLFDSYSGLTCYSRHYAAPYKTMWHVAAYSIKQAYYLAGNDVWVSESADTGIVEHHNGQDATQWRYWDGTKDWSARHEHGKVFKKHKSQTK